MIITIKINTDNAAFEDASEVSRIIDSVAKKIRNGKNYGKCMDINGNSVGTWEINE